MLVHGQALSNAAKGRNFWESMFSSWLELYKKNVARFCACCEVHAGTSSAVSLQMCHILAVPQMVSLCLIRALPVPRDVCAARICCLLCYQPCALW